MRRRALLRLKVLLPVGLLTGGGALVRAQCVADWGEGFSAPGMGYGPFGEPGVYAVAPFDDDGPGPHAPALYAAGNFFTAGNAIARYIAKWDGSAWYALPEIDFYFVVRALAVFDDDGDGLHLPALYVAGWGAVHKWDGTAWSPVGWPAGDVDALAVFDDGTGPALYVAGAFDEVAGVPTGGIAKWDGSNWSAVGTGMFSWPWGAEVRALAVFDDGTGPALYAGGEFSEAGDVPAYNIAKWDGSAWSDVDVGVWGVHGVYALQVFDDGAGPALYVGGDFIYTGSGEARRIAKWDGVQWSALGSGIGPPDMTPVVYALGVFNDGTALGLYVGGYFNLAGDTPAPNLAKWDGSGWSSVGLIGNSVYSFTVFDDGSGPGLVIGGAFTVAGSGPATGITKWDGTAFSPLGQGNGVSGRIGALTVFDDGNGSALYAAGDFATAGPALAYHIGRWDGASWSALPTGPDACVYALEVWDDGSGPALFVSGNFASAGGVTVNRIARWDGSNWSALASGFDQWLDYVGHLAVFDDGTGPALYAGGDFDFAGGVPASNIAKWDGANWSALGAGVEPDGHVSALGVFDDGSGPGLYVGGDFVTAGGVTVNSIAKWDGWHWSALGNGVSACDWGPVVLALAVFDDGTGPALYVGGYFCFAGGVPVDCIAKWDGHNWSALPYAAWDTVMALAVFDDGSGPALYAAGGGPEEWSYSVAKWNGSRWSALGAGIDYTVYALCGFDDGSGPALYAGGLFTVAGRHASVNFAKWVCVPGLLRGDVNCDGTVNEFDIDPFVRALVNPQAYNQEYPDCDIRTADCNQDGSVNAFDIDAFVDCLTVGCP